VRREVETWSLAADGERYRLGFYAGRRAKLQFWIYQISGATANAAGWILLGAGLGWPKQWPLSVKQSVPVGAVTLTQRCLQVGFAHFLSNPQSGHLGQHQEPVADLR